MHGRAREQCCEHDLVGSSSVRTASAYALRPTSTGSGCSRARERPGHQRWRAGFLKGSLWFLFRRKRHWRVERANRVYRALAPICKPGLAEAAAEKYYREHTGSEDPRSIDDAILVAIHGERTKRKAGEQWGEG